MRRFLRGGLILVLLVAIPQVVAFAPAGAGAATLQGVDGNTYESPTYGYTMSWDDDWSVSQEFSENNFDLIELENTESTLWLEGQVDFNGDPQACLEDSLAEIEGESAITNVEPYEDSNGKTVAGDDERSAWAAYSVEVELEDGSSGEVVAYLECQTLIPGEAALEITHITAAKTYKAESQAVDDILGTLDIPDEITLAPSEPENGGTVTTDQLVALMTDAAENIDQFWTAAFAQAGLDYESPEVIYYDAPVETSCGGAAPMEVGPHYCPPDKTIFMDVPFMEEYVLPFGEFASAFVVAHEWGHHIQNLLGIQKCPVEQCLGGTTSIEMELQADCLAGSWTRSADDQGQLQFGDTEAAIVVLAKLVGDPEGTQADDPAVHGPGTLRAWWFLQGYYNGIGSCLADASSAGGGSGLEDFGS